MAGPFKGYWFPVYLGLSKHSCSPEKIQYVVCTHGHSDHVGNLNVFPGAIHIVSHDVCVGDQYMLHDFKQVTTLSALIFNTGGILYLIYGKCSKILNTFHVRFSNKLCWFSGLEFTKCLPEMQTGKILIRLVLQKQSGLDLQCISGLLVFAILEYILYSTHFLKIIFHSRPSDKGVQLKIIFQPKHMLWVLKRTVSMRPFFWSPKTCV